MKAGTRRAKPFKVVCLIFVPTNEVWNRYCKILITVAVKQIVNESIHTSVQISTESDSSSLQGTHQDIPYNLPQAP